MTLHREGIVLYSQIPSEFISTLSQEERLVLATYLYLKVRFQSGVIHESLDEKASGKAGRSSRQLRRMLDRLCKPFGSLGRLAVKLHEVNWNSIDPAKDNALQARCRKMGRGWVLADRPTFERRIRAVVPRHSRARSTVKITRSMDVYAIRSALNKKVFESLGSQVLYKRNLGSRSTGEHASNARIGQFPLHPSAASLGSAVKHQAQMPSKAFSARMGISRGTFFRQISQWEREGSVKRINRRVRLEPVDDPESFLREWGMMPFRCGNLWYGQLPNLYEFTQDYRGPHALLRRDLKGFGLRCSELLARVRQ